MIRISGQLQVRRATMADRDGIQRLTRQLTEYRGKVFDGKRFSISFLFIDTTEF